MPSSGSLPGRRSSPRSCSASSLTRVERERGKAWAFQQAMGLVWYYADSNPAMSRTGRRTLARILASA